MNDSNSREIASEAYFLQLILMFQVAAMQQMGKVMNPITQKIERDLDQAKMSIDMLEMLKQKTGGNLSDKEQEFLERVLFELHMNYVDEVDRAKKERAEAKESEERESEEKVRSGGGSEPGDKGKQAEAEREGKKKEPPDRTERKRRKKSASKGKGEAKSGDST